MDGLFIMDERVVKEEWKIWGKDHTSVTPRWFLELSSPWEVCVCVPVNLYLHFWYFKFFFFKALAVVFAWVCILVECIVCKAVGVSVLYRQCSSCLSGYIVVGDTVWLPGQKPSRPPWDLVRKPLCQRIILRLKGTWQPNFHLWIDCSN